MKRIHIFRAGRHTDAAGRTVEFLADDLKATAEAYDPALHEAPIVVGHPRTDDPAYGWVEKLHLGGSGLLAEPRQVDPQFAELVRAGRFRKVSASFYLPDTPSNPKPGVYYLRHVGFLGAQPPAVKGLRQVELGEAGEGVVEFAAEAASEERGLAEWLLGLFRRHGAAGPGFAEGAADAGKGEKHQEGSMTMTKEQLEQRKRELEQREAEFAEREKKIQQAERKGRRRDITEFVEAQVKAGRLLPREKAPMLELLAVLPAGEIEFAEGDGTLKKAPETVLRELIEALPARVDYAERAATEKRHPSRERYVAPEGFEIDRDSLALHEKAVAYAEQNKVDYTTAVLAVQR